MLTGKLILSMPQISDSRFNHSVIYICSHMEQGAMGLILNKVFDSVSFAEVLKQFDLNIETPFESVPVYFGGPVETGRGFVLHSNDFSHEGTMNIDENVSLTATLDILKSIAHGQGPSSYLLALGYAGWGPGQLEHEIQENSWLIAPADPKIIFDDRLQAKWTGAMQTIGVDTEKLSSEMGHA